MAAISSLFAIKQTTKLDVKYTEKSFTEEISVMKKFLNGIKMNKDKYLFLECLLREINYEKINKKTFKKIFLKEYKIYKIHLKERNDRLKKLK